MESSSSLFGTPLNINLSEILDVPGKYRKGVVRCRLLYGKYPGPVQFFPYEKKKIVRLKLVYCDEVEYPMKRCDRSVLDRLMERREDCDDILIVKGGYVTDSSKANILFFNGTSWYTPENPLLHGTCRERLLSEHKIIPVPITPGDIILFKGFKLINALRLPEDEEMIPVTGIT